MQGAALAILIPVVGTTLGSAFVFMMRDAMPRLMQKGLLGFASGVMVAASVWSLLIPGIEMRDDLGNLASVPAAVGFVMGMAFLLLVDTLIPHLHADSKSPEGPKSHLSRAQMLALAVAIHNLPEGMAVGVVVADAMAMGGNMTASGALAVSLGIAIQNVPEGAIISMPMKAAGGSSVKSFSMGTLSGLVEPLGAVAVILLAGIMEGLLPYLLGFAAGAMLFVVVEELIPEASSGRHSNISVIGFGVGFVLMMLMDTILG